MPPPPPPPVPAPLTFPFPFERVRRIPLSAADDDSSNQEDKYSSAATIGNTETLTDSLPGLSKQKPKLTPPEIPANTMTGLKKVTPSGKWGFGWGFGKKEKEESPPTPSTSLQVNRKVSQGKDDGQKSRITRSRTLESHKYPPTSYAGESTITLIGSALERKINGADSANVITDTPKRYIIRKSGRPSPLEASSSTLVDSASERKINDVEIVKEKPGASTRLEQLRDYMLQGNLDYYIVPSENAHLSESVAPSDKRREYISGYTGSSGTAIIASDKAYLIVDANDSSQANEQVDENWTVVKTGASYGPRDWIDWLVDRLKNSRIGVDARMISYEKGTFLNSKVVALNSKLVFPPQNFVDLVWKDKPQKPKEKVYKQLIEFGAAEANYKIHKLREWIKKYSPPGPSQIHAGTLLTSLPSVAYMLNMRGSDIPFNSLFYAYLFVGLESAILFIDANKVHDDMTEYLSSINVQRKDYNDVWPFLQRREWGSGKILILPQTCYVVSLILTHTRMTLAPSYVEYMMSITNEAEIRGLKRVRVGDKASYDRWIDWLELNLVDKSEKSNENAQHLPVLIKSNPVRTNASLQPKISSNLEAPKSASSRPSSSSKRTVSNQRSERDIPVQAGSVIMEMQERPGFGLAILALIQRMGESTEAVS